MEAHRKSNQFIGTHYTFNTFVRESFNHGPSPSKIDWGDAIDVPMKHGPNYTSNGCILKEVDWGDKLNLDYTSYGYMLMEIDWGANSTASHVDVQWLTGKVMEHTPY